MKLLEKRPPRGKALVEDPRNIANYTFNDQSNYQLYRERIEQHSAGIIIGNWVKIRFGEPTLTMIPHTIALTQRQF